MDTCIFKDPFLLSFFSLCGEGTDQGGIKVSRVGAEKKKEGGRMQWASWEGWLRGRKGGSLENWGARVSALKMCIDGSCQGSKWDIIDVATAGVDSVHFEIAFQVQLS